MIVWRCPACGWMGDGLRKCRPEPSKSCLGHCPKCDEDTVLDRLSELEAAVWHGQQSAK